MPIRKKLKKEGDNSAPKVDNLKFTPQRSMLIKLSKTDDKDIRVTKDKSKLEGKRGKLKLKREIDSGSS